MQTHPDIVISVEDAERLAELIGNQDTSGAAVAELLDDELARATILPAAALPAEVVAMNSTVRFQDLGTGQEHEITLVYPDRADVTAGRISVLTRLGSALLGLSVGQEITWPMPRGRERRVRVLAVSPPHQMA